MSTFMQDANLKTVMAPRSTYSFPILKAEEITKCINELGLAVSLDDIANPDKNRDATRRTLEFLVEICLGISREELYHPSEHGMHALNFPELHDDSVLQINLFRACLRMMETCDVSDFSIKDFIFPSGSRFRRHLSGVINFAKFREERLVLLADLSAKRSGLVDHMEQLRDQYDSINNRLQLLKEQTADESEAIELLETECKAIESNITRLNDLQLSVKDETATLKDQNIEFKSRIEELTAKYEDSMRMKERLNGEVVSSPEKFRRQIIEVGQNLQTEQKDAKIAERKVRDLSAWLVNVEESQHEVTAALELLQEVRLEVDRQKGIIMDLDAQKHLTSANSVALSEIEQNVSQLQRQTTRTEDKLQHLRQQAGSRGSEDQESLESLHQQIIDAEAFKLQVSAL